MDAAETVEVAGPQRPSRGVAALTGVTVAALGLAVAELVTGFSRSWTSPVVQVADRVVDNSPVGIRDWSRETFGTSQKAVLIWGVLVLTAIGGALLGRAALRGGRFVVALGGVAVFGVVGAWASVSDPVAGASSAVPSLVGAAAAAAVLVVVRRGWSSTPEVSSRNTVLPPPGRRRFILDLGVVAALAAIAGSIGRRLQSGGAIATEREELSPLTADTPLPPPPEGAELGLANLSPLITPNEEFYRIDTALGGAPRVSVEDWKLAVHGMVGRRLELTYQELIERPLFEADVTIACVSNEVGGHLIGNARWLGCRLDDLLDEAGIDPNADQIVGRSADGWTSGFPVAVLDGRDAMVAVAMNDEVLPIEHGYPARLIVPGLYGYVSATKWLTEIELTRFDAFEAYWVPRGWSAEGPIKTQSRIDRPHPYETLAVGRNVVAGVAWAPTRGIEKVEVQVDDGSWREATLAEELADTTWRQWRIDVELSAGDHTLACRATDGDGQTQTAELSSPRPDGATGHHRIRIEVE